MSNSKNVKISLFDGANKNPEKIFICSKDRKLSNNDVINESFFLTGKFRQEGICEKDKVVLFLPNSIEFVISILALWRIGAVPIPLNPKLNKKLLSEQLIFSDSKFILSTDIELKVDCAKSIIIDLDRTTNPVPSESFVNLDSVALMQFTSGSSGIPKLVPLTFSNIFASIECTNSLSRLSESDYWFASLPFFHIGGFSILTRSFFTNASVYIIDNFKVEDFKSVLEVEQITHLSLVPTMLNELLNDRIGFPSSLKAVYIGGAASTQGLLKEALELGLPIFKVYGSTETCSMISGFPLREFPHKIESSGLPLKNVKIDIDGKEGRIKIKSETITKGYYKLEALSHSSFTKGEFCSNDVGWIDTDGFLFVQSRADRIINSGGEKIDPAEVESVLMQIPGISDCAVFGKPDKKWGESLTAAIVSKDNSTSRDSIQTYLEGKLINFKIPKEYYFVDKIPKSAIEKIDLKSLLEKIGI
ncbi:MAG: o-succinylbenzoate--CoA ligase [Melioribacteraceae bacterium]|nr:o-succinylbenzoate--CoA ligase [Melioribacteraceae bacterium]MCF8263281.1 o-succinylbenzoate--CoA ligase [Melioribacteraceae bacterium]MCF8412977.1 o-succinylbenzoate--CoA ligase [Melioribacteraceae bacterium]MCF8432421.1 o-succinylbenzoate--CoA ligase [Melioribacteraceae bacterium]